MGTVKNLAKDTAIYGLSSIVGRFLNWCLVPLYTIMFSQQDYGVVTFVYSVVAVALIVLTYGLETGFFRFANHQQWHDPMQVYSTALISLLCSNTIFLVLVFSMLEPVTVWMECAGHESYVAVMAVCVALDAFLALPFSYLRFRNKAARFAVIKLVNIGVNIGLNLFFILACPWLMRHVPGTVSWFYDPDYSIGYIFLANLMATVTCGLMLLPELHGFKWTFSVDLWRQMLRYSAPLLVLGIAGIMNQTIDKILFPTLCREPDALAQLGIYGANYKIAIVMVMFIQAFRFAYEPFIFAQNKKQGGDAKKSYSDAMKFFIIMGLFIFMFVMFYLDILRYFISERYFSGLAVVPIVMAAEFFFGIFFNLSVWYKLTDRTIWGAWFSLGGLAITIGLNVALVPRWGYMGCAWAAFACYFAMMVVSFRVGQTKYPIDYNIRSLVINLGVAAVLYVLGMYVLATGVHWIDWSVRAVLLAVYMGAVMKIEHVSPRMLIQPMLKKVSR